MMDCTRKVVATEGIGALTKGIVPTVVRAFPCNATTFLVVEFVTSFEKKVSFCCQSIVEFPNKSSF